jgi:transcriptional regulator with XRE-family HTH domain
MAEGRLTPAEINICVGQRIRALRQERGLTLKQVGDALGLRPQQIQKYEVAKNSMTVSRLVEFANCLHVPPAALLGELADVDK